MAPVTPTIKLLNLKNAFSLKFHQNLISGFEDIN